MREWVKFASGHKGGQGEHRCTVAVQQTQVNCPQLLFHLEAWDNGIVFHRLEIEELNGAMLTDLGWMNVTKSMVKCPTMPLARHALLMTSHASLRASGSTEDWGIERPQKPSWVSAWTWSPLHTTRIFPVGSISMSTEMAVTLSDGGHASMIPPGHNYKRHIIKSSI